MTQSVLLHGVVIGALGYGVYFYKQQPKRPLAFRFGYPDKKWHGHLIIMRRAKK